jgi:hypothetical protein
MKDTILERLNKIEDLKQRKLLKNIITGVFVNLQDYQENMYERIKKQVFDEVTDTEEKYNIYITLCEKEKFDPVNECFYPIIKDDLEDEMYDMKQIAKRLIAKENIKLFTIFMKCDYEEIKNIVMKKETYKGEIITDKGKHEIEIKLEQNKNYIHEIEKLYNIFQKNGITWATVNNPYANKFFDVVLINSEEMQANENVLSISFDLKEHEQYKQMDIVPLWNIEKISIRSGGFPVPAQDKINLEHIVALKNLGEQNGFLVDDSEDIVKYVIHLEESLNIVASEDRKSAWNLLKIIQPEHNRVLDEIFECQVFSNKQKDNFINKYKKKHEVIIRTKGEINQIVNSFEVATDFQLKDIEIKDQIGEMQNTYDMNSFIVDEIRMGIEKKIMLLKFEVKKSHDFINYDLISFLTSEVQMYFPEYKCEGVLV